MNTSINCSISVTEFFSWWLKKIENEIKQSTFALYSRIVDTHLKPHLGSKMLCELDDTVIHEYINKLLDYGRIDGLGGLSPQTVNDILTILKSAIHTMQRKYNICTDIEINKVKECRKEIILLDNTERETLESHCLNNLSHITLGIMILLITGLRIGELCALTWENIDFDKGVVRIKKTLQRIKNTSNGAKTKTIVVIDTPKSLYSVRDIPIPSFLIKLLKAIKDKSTNDCYILSGKIKYIEPRSFEYRYKKIMKNLDITVINVHSLRHVFANHALDLGMDIKTLSEILGHSSVQITMDLYIHSSLNKKREQMKIFDRNIEKMAQQIS